MEEDVDLGYLQSVRQWAIFWVDFCCLEIVRVRHDQEGGLPM